MVKYVILYNVRSSYNVGAIFRTCDAAGVEKIFLTGYTPAPIDRFGRPVAEIVKTSLGASAMVAWEKIDDIKVLIHKIQQEGFVVAAVEQSPKSVSIYDFSEPNNIAYIMGNEITGVIREVLDECDVVLEIPMHGQKESLNVSVSTGIILFQKQNA